MVIEKKSLIIGILIGAALILVINSPNIGLSPECACAGDTCAPGEMLDEYSQSCVPDGTEPTGELGLEGEEGTAGTSECFSCSGDTGQLGIYQIMDRSGNVIGCPSDLNKWASDCEYTVCDTGGPSATAEYSAEGDDGFLCPNAGDTCEGGECVPCMPELTGPVTITDEFSQTDSVCVGQDEQGCATEQAIYNLATSSYPDVRASITTEAYSSSSSEWQRITLSHKGEVVCRIYTDFITDISNESSVCSDNACCPIC